MFGKKIVNNQTISSNDEGVFVNFQKGQELPRLILITDKSIITVKIETDKLESLYSYALKKYFEGKHKASGLEQKEKGKEQ